MGVKKQLHFIGKIKIGDPYDCQGEANQSLINQCEGNYVANQTHLLKSGCGSVKS